jgi:patatin-like phospholipase/acyl hydrolase
MSDNTQRPDKPYRILAMDGGGMRGIMEAQMLVRIQEHCPDFLKNIDMVAGTSAGAINAAALALQYPKSPAEIVETYLKHGEKIFTKQCLPSLKGVVSSRYTNQGREELLNNLYGNTKLGEVKKDLLIVTYQLDSLKNPYQPSNDTREEYRTWKATLYHRFPSNPCDKSKNREATLVDIVMRSSAAPSYFPVYQGFTDGGVFANNPSMCAVVEAADKDTGRRNTEDLVLLSLGTGQNRDYYYIRALNPVDPHQAQLDKDNPKWGLFSWGTRLIELMFSATSELQFYLSIKLLEDRCKRINPLLPEPIGLDATGPKILQLMLDVVDDHFAKNSDHIKAWLERYWC